MNTVSSPCSCGTGRDSGDKERPGSGSLTIVKHDEQSQTLAIIDLARVTMALQCDDTPVTDEENEEDEVRAKTTETRS